MRIEVNSFRALDISINNSKIEDLSTRCTFRVSGMKEIQRSVSPIRFERGI